MLPEHFKRNYNSQAGKESMVVSGKCRFTVLTECLIRIEYDTEKFFEDRATQGVINRDFKKAEFAVTQNDGVLKIETSKLCLTYKKGTKPSKTSLTIGLKNLKNKPVWHFGDTVDTLKGTHRNLDGAGDRVPIKNFPMSEGVCSENGFAIIDESGSLILLEDGFVEQRKSGVYDLYFFGYGHDYYGATAALYQLTGIPPLLPSYVFGNWWSRFHAYTQQEYIDLIDRFKAENIPFSVAVIDMDWHWSRGSSGKQWFEEWTGYSWDTNRFPDYKAFLKYLRDNGLYPSLNLHPASGIQDHEDMYEEMAKAMGQNPETKKPVKFQPENRDFWKPYFEIVHHPYEENGVEFWWMDWQQGTESGMQGLDPLWALNHFHGMDCARGERRPMFFSRYSGVGSQRYYVGFSGDTAIKWEVLNFEPYFTATAANIGYPYWSHDLGGFELGVRDDELYTRWIQFGAFSPVCRLHCTDNDFMGKEPWNYGEEAEKITKDVLRLRHSLFPYLYTMNYRTHTELKALCTPMYYDYPEIKNAYKVPNEYMFGSEMLVCPVTAKRDKKTLLSKVGVWLPEGYWTDLFSGIVYKGGKTLGLYRALDEIPVFLKSGAIVPMNTLKKDNNSQAFSDSLELIIAPGADNSFTLYEDEGINNNYLNSAFVKTEFNLSYGKNKALFKISPPVGDKNLILENRNYNLIFKGFSSKADIKVIVNGKAVDVKTKRDASKNTVYVALRLTKDAQATIELTSEEGFAENYEAVKQKAFNILLKSLTDNMKKPAIFDAFKYKDTKKEQRLEILLNNSGTQKTLFKALKEILDTL